MKRFSALLFVAAFGVYHVHSQSIIDSAAIGAGGLEYDVYYNINTTTGYQTDANWDIAVSVQPANPPLETLKAAAIRINAGRGVELYKITDADTSNFMDVFDAANSVNWLPLHDSPTSWDLGAFNGTLDPTNAFDYGWGSYNLTTHSIASDSIYAVKTLDGSFKKINVKKLSFDTTFYLVIADLDNANMYTQTVVKSDYPGKNFAYLNLQDATVMDKEPATWDMLFTRYADEVAPGMFYPVNGVLINKGVEAVRAAGIDTATVSFTGFASAMSSAINVIGYDWKAFDMGTGEYTIEDSTVYFVKAKDNNIYRLRFLNYKISNGESVFELKFVQPAGIEALNPINDLVVYPNPTADVLNVIDFGAAGKTQYRMYNAAGIQFTSAELSSSSQSSIGVSHLSNGLYFVQFIQNGFTATRTFVVNR